MPAWELGIPLVLAAVTLLGFVGCGFSAQSTPPYNQAVQDEPSLVGWWILTEDPPPNQLVDSRDGHSGVYTSSGVTLGGPSLLGAANAPQTSALFSGGHATVAYGSDGPALNQLEFSVEALVAEVGAGGVAGAIVSSADPVAHTGYALVAGASGFWEAWLGDGSTFHVLVTGARLEPAMHYLVLTFDGNHAELYDDGLSAGRQAIPNFAPNTTADLTIGGQAPDPASASLNARLNDVALYNRALDQVQVVTHFAGISSAGLVKEPIPTTICPPDFAKSNGITLATLRGTVDTQGDEASYFFEWGQPADGYPNKIPPPLGPPVMGTGAVPESADVQVMPTLQYHHRIVAVDRAGNPTTGDECLFTVPDLYRDAVTTNPHLLGYWRLDETPSGGQAPTAAADSSGNNHIGTYVSLPPASFGVPGIIQGDPAVHFPGGAAAPIPHAEIPPLVSADFSIEFWFQSSAGVGNGNTQWYQGAGLVDGDVLGVNNDYGTSLDATGRVWAGTGNPNTSINSGPGFNDGTWHHVVFTRVRSSGTLTLYVDGIQRSTGTAGTQLLNSPPHLNIGALQSAPVGHAFVGALDEVALYDAALDAVTVGTHYSLGKPT